MVKSRKSNKIPLPEAKPEATPEATPDSDVSKYKFNMYFDFTI